MKQLIMFKLTMLFGAFAGVVFGCSNFEEKQNTLDENPYLEASCGEYIYPISEQIEMIKSVMPEAIFQLAPPASNRRCWDKMAATKEGKESVMELDISDISYAFN